MERLSAWYSVAHALCSVVACSLTDIEVVDFWPTARGIRVAYKWRDKLSLRDNDEMQATIPLPQHEVEMLMLAVRY